MSVMPANPDEVRAILPTVGGEVNQGFKCCYFKDVQSGEPCDQTAVIMNVDYHAACEEHRSEFQRDVKEDIISGNLLKIS
jgi:hypothetical protein